MNNDMCNEDSDIMPLIVKNNKKFSCHREVARCFVSLNISLSHWRLLKVIGNSTIR